MTATIEKIKGIVTFPGGVHPPGSKSLSCDSAIQPGPVVKQLSILLSQHIGAGCQPIVKKGDVVQAGQKVGDCDAFVCAPVHSPVSGKVVDIALRPALVIGRGQAIIIEAADENPRKPLEFSLKEFDINKYPGEQINKAIREAGTGPGLPVEAI